MLRVSLCILLLFLKASSIASLLPLLLPSIFRRPCLSPTPSSLAQFVNNLLFIISTPSIAFASAYPNRWHASPSFSPSSSSPLLASIYSMYLDNLRRQILCPIEMTADA